MKTTDKFLSITIGLNVDLGAAQQTRKLAKVCFSERGEVVVAHIESAGNMSVIKSSGQRIITKDDYNNRPTDPYDSIVEAKWAFGLFGVSI